MPNLTDTDYKKMNIDESFKANTRDDLKAIYKINWVMKMLTTRDVSLLKF